KTKLTETVIKIKELGVIRVSSISGTDLGNEIDVIYHFIHKKKTINIRVSLDKKTCTVDSITGIFPGANLFERELAEMLGIDVKNHPNLKKLFLCKDSPENPLRKS
ncbi:MAG: NADH-quinone oxidoreductase subunit C, partial [Candidatus Aenigmarchaeota archaeon]|nr:NADH-quinone oxidoreductase subunit C [Candidatus Aenigmarchaeota archaeon]